MSYTKTTWRNNQSPAINADNLNHIEQGIYDAHDGLASANNNMELMNNRLQGEIDDANSDISTLESNLAAETSARTQQDSVLSARMDTFTQLPSGSTSGDAELIDIRVGADGTTYPTAGDAVRGQVTDLKSDINAVVTEHKNYFEGRSAHDGYWKRQYPANWSSAGTMNAFYPIDITAGKTYYYRGVYLYWSCVIYDGETSATTFTADTSTNHAFGSFVATKNGKAYFSALKTETPLFTDDADLYNGVGVGTYYTPNKLRLVDKTENLIERAGYVDGYYINGQGQDSASSSYRLSNYINVIPDTIYDLAFKGQFFIAFYDSNKTFISRPIYYTPMTLAKCKVHVPSDAAFVRMSWAIATHSDTSFAEEIDGAVFHVGSSFPYTKVSDAVNDATESLGNTIIIHDGTYDLFEELGGSEYFDSFTYSDDGEGLVLKNEVYIRGSSGSLITFNYSGSNTQVKQYFSVFNAGQYGFTLENVNIQCSNCRYAIHDERYTDNDMYINKYINCNFEIDNSANTYGYAQCIGGGLGTNGEIVVKDCFLKTVNPRVLECLSYHNSSASGAKSRIIATGNYCDGGSMRFSWHGSSARKTEIIASNNSLPSAITTRAESSSDSVENISLKEWNNEIRS